MTQRMSITPASPVAGSNYKVCYDFDGLPGGVTSVTLHVVNQPAHPDDPQVIVITRGSTGQTFCHEVTTPVGGIGQTIVDISGNSDAYGLWLS